MLKPLPGLTDAAVAAVSRWKYEPARLHGRPVEVYYNLTINFRLPGGVCVRPAPPPVNPWQ